MLAFQRLKIGYPDTAIADEATSFVFDASQLVVLLGRNGSGKTTLLKTLMQSILPLAGNITLHGKALKQHSAKELAKQISIVTTERLQTPYLTVYDLIAMGRYPYLGFLGKLQPADEQFIQQIIERLSIGHLQKKYLTNCSDGEQQLVLIARALAQDTPIILLDEATAHLDFVNRVKIFQVLQSLAVEQQKLLFLATHELEIALQFAHQVILFGEQKLQIQPPADLIASRAIEAVFEVEGLDYKLSLKR